MRFVLFSRFPRQLEQCHSPCLTTGITEPYIYILHFLQDSTASHFMVCNLHFDFFSSFFLLPFFPCVWWRREGVLINRRWLGQGGTWLCSVSGCFSIPSAALELNVQLWQRGKFLNSTNFPRVMKRCGAVGQEVSVKSWLLPTCTGHSGLWPAKQTAGGEMEGRDHWNCRRWMGTT